MALNPADPHRLPFQTELLPLALKKGMGVIGMKIRRAIGCSAPMRLDDEGRDELRAHAAVSTVIIGCKTVEQLEENITIAKNFTPLPKAEMAPRRTHGGLRGRGAVVQEAPTPGAPVENDQNTD